eukprot:6205342-Pleurochrysis_carterae.AAC.2
MEGVGIQAQRVGTETASICTDHAHGQPKDRRDVDEEECGQAHAAWHSNAVLVAATHPVRPDPLGNECTEQDPVRALPSDSFCAMGGACTCMS